MSGFILGADGGATKTVGVLADEFGKVLVERNVGPTNAHVVGIDAAVSTLSVLVRELCAVVGCSIEDIRSAVLGLAGAGRARVRERLHEELSKSLMFTGMLTIETDARVALEGAFGGDAGVVVVAGTGSIVIGKGPDGSIASAGGWGRIVGDEGSGYALGVAALKMTAALIDKGAASSMLTLMVMQTTGATAREDFLSAVYQNGFDPSSLAPLVLEAAEQNDPSARMILEEGAAALASQAQVLVQRLRFDGVVPLVLLGGLLQHENAYRRMVVSRIRAAIPRVDCRAPLHAPAVGAVLMALRQAGRSAGSQVSSS